jgi:uncharacterized membrane protein YfcA
MWELLAAGMVVLLGALVQTAFGFGIAVVGAPLLVMIYPAALPGPLVAMALVQCVLMALQHRRHIELAPLGSAMVGRIPGSLLGAWLLTAFSAGGLSIFVGAAVLLAVAASGMRVSIRPSRHSMFWAGALSGVFGTSTSVGGPPMALLLQHQEARHLRGNLAAFFIYGCVVSLLMLLFMGRFGRTEVMISLYLLPWTLAGYYLCRFIPLQRFEASLRPGILLLCTVSGVTAILSAL